LSNFFDTNGNLFSFKTKSGTLTVCINRENELYEMDFPARKAKKTEINQIEKRHKSN